MSCCEHWQAKPCKAVCNKHNKEVSCIGLEIHCEFKEQKKECQYCGGTGMRLEAALGTPVMCVFCYGTGRET
jgi:hypothetical protein